VWKSRAWCGEPSALSTINGGIDTPGLIPGTMGYHSVAYTLYLPGVEFLSTGHQCLPIRQSGSDPMWAESAVQRFVQLVDIGCIGPPHVCKIW